MATYQVIVGNIGKVYEGTSRAFADSAFLTYKHQSQSNRGRAGNEDVTLFKDGEPIVAPTAASPATVTIARHNAASTRNKSRTMPNVEHHAGAYLITGRGYGRDGLLVQVDWDYPGVAQELGWNMRRVQIDKRTGNARHLQRAPNRDQGCYHSSTDGTVTCDECGASPMQFIRAAAAYLDSLC